MTKPMLKKNIENSILSCLSLGILLSLVKGGSLVSHFKFSSFFNGSQYSYLLCFSSIYMLCFSLIGFVVGILATFMLKEKNASSQIIGVNCALCFFVFLSPWEDVLFGAGTFQELFFYSSLVSICINIGYATYLLVKKIQFSFLDNKAIKIFSLSYFIISLIVFGLGYERILSSQESNSHKAEKTISRNRNTPAFKDKNVILIVIDTLRADHLSCYGYERKTSPNIDNFASSGVLFTNAIVQKGKTSPSVASILTGTYPATHGIDGCGAKLYEDALTIPEVLKKHGYKTCSVVANSNLGYEFNFDQGFDTVYEMWKPSKSDDGLKRDGNPESVTAMAIDWLEKNHQDKFFLYVHYIGPHSPYKPPAPYNKLFLKDEFYGKYKANLGIPRKLEIQSTTYWNAIHKENVFLKGPFENDYDYYISQYDGEIRNHDESIGHLLKKIKELGVDENTLIILTSDHGENLGESDVYFNHGIFAYEASARVPFIVNYPKLSGNKQSEFLVQSIDIFPTISAFLGLKRNKKVPGNSLMTILLNPDLKKPDYEEFGVIEGNYGSGIETALRTREWKLIYKPYTTGGRRRVALNLSSFYSPSFVLGAGLYYNALTTVPIKNYNMMYQLYNVKDDPDEQNNLFDKEPVLALSMREELHDWLRRNPRSFVDDLKRNTKNTNTKLSKETLNNLKALGYIN